MEAADIGHLGFEHVITLLMIHSVSPHARRLVEKIFTDDPYLVDVRLDANSSNRSAEILAAYMKAIGYRLEFIKTRKFKIKPFLIQPFYRKYSNGYSKPFLLMDKNQQIKDMDEYLKWIEEQIEKIKAKPIMYQPFYLDDK